MNKIRVYIIEDDPMVSSINCRFLERLEDFKVVGTARNGKEAIDALSTIKIDLVLLDIYLPNLNGIEIARKIREADISTDIIMITAATDISLVTQALRLGVVDYIIKPYNFARFSDSMKKYKNRFYNLTGTDVNQEIIDSITNSSPIQDNMDKGIDKDTLNKIKSFLSGSSNSITAEKLAQSIGISRVTARRYLEYMVSSGSISSKNEYHKVGRPEKIYTLNM